MSRQRIGAFAVVGVLSLAAALVVQRIVHNGSRPAGPAAQFDTTEFDAGTIRDGNVRTIEHRFTLRNIGRQPLIVSEVKTDCGCTVAELSKREIAPDETVTIQTRMTFKLIGANRNQILIDSNAGRSVLTLRAYYDPPPLVNVIPKRLDLHADGSPKPSVVNVEVLTVPPYRIEIEKASTRDSRLTVTRGPVMRASPPGNGEGGGYFQANFELTVSAAPSARAWQGHVEGGATPPQSRQRHDRLSRGAVDLIDRRRDRPGRGPVARARAARGLAARGGRVRRIRDRLDARGDHRKRVVRLLRRRARPPAGHAARRLRDSRRVLVVPAAAPVQ